MDFSLIALPHWEWSGNRCSTGCLYCFDHLNNPTRRGDEAQSLRLLSELHHANKKGVYKRKSYAAQLLREQYPIVISNHVDPLAKSNWEPFNRLMQLLNLNEVPVYILTKWGADEYTGPFFEMLARPTAIYTSISSMDADLLGKKEPNAPTPQKRFENINRAVSEGHTCIVGINPLVEDWLGDPRPLLQACVDNGVKGVWVHDIYFSNRKLKNMPTGKRKLLGEEIVQLGLNNRKRGADYSYRYEVARIAKEEYGLEVYMSGQGSPSKFWEPCQKLYPKRFPLMQDFVNWAHAELQPGDEIYFDDWYDAMIQGLPVVEHGLRDHINAVTAFGVLNGKMIPQRMTYSDLLAYAWMHYEIAFSPVNTNCFQYAVDIKDPKKMTWVNVVDEINAPILIFNPNGSHEDYCFTTEHNL